VLTKKQIAMPKAVPRQVVQQAIKGKEVKPLMEDDKLAKRKWNSEN